MAANISAKELVDALKGYAYTYDYAGKTSDNGKVLEELYVTVTQATEAAELSNDASIASITVKGETVAKLGDGETNTINCLLRRTISQVRYQAERCWCKGCGD